MNFIYTIIVALIISLAFPGQSRAYFELTNHTGANLSENGQPGDWELSTIEDPITDEISYLLCKNSNDRIEKGGSMGMLCIEYIKSKNKLLAYIKDSGTFHDGTTYEILRYGKDKPSKHTLKLDKSSFAGTLFQLNPQEVIDALKDDKRIAFRIENYQGSKGKRQTYVFEASKSSFMREAEPLLNEIQ